MIENMRDAVWILAGFLIIPSARGGVRANAIFGSEEFPALIARLDQSASRQVSAAEITALKAGTLHLEAGGDASLALANTFSRDEMYFEAESNYRNGNGLYRVTVFRSGWVRILHNRTDQGYENIKVSSVLEAARMIQAAAAAVDERRSDTVTTSTITMRGTRH